MIKVLVFDWGDTLMRDFPEYPGPMADWPEVAVIPGAAEALEDLHRKYICCVASNAGDSDAYLMGLALERAGLRKYFQRLFTSRELGTGKPNPEFFRAAALRLGIEPGECVMIGNSYEQDIAPAKAAGLQTVLVGEVSEAERSARFPAADAVVCSLSELAGVIAP